MQYLYNDSVTPSSPHYSRPADLAEAQRDDLDFLRGFLTADWGYSDGLRTQASEEIDRAQNGTLPMSGGALALVAAHVAAIDDNGHTNIVASSLATSISRIPIRSCILSDGVYVVRALPQAQSLLGTRLLAVNGYPIDTVRAAMRAYTGGTVEWRDTRVPLYLETPSMLKAAGFGSSDSAETLTVLRQDGHTESVALTAIHDETDGAAAIPCKNLHPQLAGANQEGWISALANRADMLMFAGDPNPFYRQAMPDVGGYYVRFDQNDDDGGVDIVKFANQTLAALLAARPKFVIVDMRFNGGGNFILTADFMRGLPKQLPDTRFYVLTSPFTFSAGITSAVFIKYEGGGRALFVGETPGDRVRYRSEGNEYCLPYSGICLMARTAIHDYTTTDCRPISQCFWKDRLYPVAIKSLKPDIFAPMTFAALRDGRDPAIEAVMRRERGLP